MSFGPDLPELFERASELPAEERERFLHQLAAVDEGSAREIRELLAAEPHTGFAVDTPARERLGAAANPERPPVRIGSYRIVREIGRGGMGRVFLAEEVREAFRRTVALKLIDRPEPGAEGAERFRNEVSILASLEHPGIARFLDGGTTDDGTWYLALELVEGEDLVSHTRRLALGVEERLRLFLGVLEAVAHAHSRRIVHRDLKPGNILVGADGRPRLLDFGVSKLVDADADSSAVTRTALRAFTPAYASPEQYRGERAGVPSDIFSLGIVLYELLTGTRPFGGVDATPARVERAILDEEPEPPSHAARRGGECEGARSSRGESERSRLGPDLDAICLKALSKTPAERYASAEALASDVRLYLAGEPVSARRRGFRGRLARRLRQHRTTMAWIAVSTATVAASLALRSRLTDRSAAAAAPFPAALTASESSEALASRFAGASEDIDLGVALVSALVREARPMEAEAIVGRMRQIPGAATDPRVDWAESLVAGRRDQPQRALVHLDRALRSAEATGRRDLLPRIRAGRARMLSDLGHKDEGRAELSRAHDAARAVGDSSTLAMILNDMAVNELESGRLAEGERLLGAARDAANAGGEKIRLGAVLFNLAGVSAQRGRPDLALPNLLRGVELFRELESRGRLAAAMSELGTVYDELGRRSEAAAALAGSIALYSGSGDESGLAYARFRVAEADVRAGRLDEAAAAVAEIEPAATASGNLESLAWAELLRAEISAARGDRIADRQFAEARRLLRENGSQDGTARAFLLQAAAAAADGDPRRTRAHAIAAAAPYRTAGESVFVFHADALLVWADVASADPTAANRRLAALADGASRPGVLDRLLYRRARAATLLEARRRDEARRELELALGEARDSERKLDELTLSLDVVEISGSEPNGTKARSVLAGVLSESRRLGLTGLERRAISIAERLDLRTDPLAASRVR